MKRQKEGLVFSFKGSLTQVPRSSAQVRHSSWSVKLHNPPF